MLKLTPPTQRRFVMSGWGRPRPYRNGWHEGLDFPDKAGAPVLAAADGVVVRVDNYDDSFAGRWIAIHHGGGMHTRYLHNLKNLVTKGQRVTRGQKIATLGTTGTKNSAPHVHFDVKFQPEAHAEYERRYGKPTTGWGKSMALLGRGVPGETFMKGVSYSPQARRWAEERGVTFYKGLAVSAPLLIVGAAVGFVWWKNR